MRLNVNVFTDMDNRERGRSRDKNKGDVFCWKKNMKIFARDVRKCEMLAATEVKLSSSKKKKKKKKNEKEKIRQIHYKKCK